MALIKAAENREVEAGEEILVPTFVPESTRPVSAEDLKDIQEQLAATANDPNMTIVTTHWFDVPNKNGNIYSGKDADIRAYMTDWNGRKSDMYLEHQSIGNNEPNLGGDWFTESVKSCYTVMQMIDDLMATLISALTTKEKQ